jgi:hypothetical protein
MQHYVIKFISYLWRVCGYLLFPHETRGLKANHAIAENPGNVALAK